RRAGVRALQGQDGYFRRLRRNLYPGGLLSRGGFDSSREAAHRTASRKGGRLRVVCDLYDRKGLPVPFFVRPARSVAIPTMIARRVGARVWLGRCVRLGSQSRFSNNIKELKVPRTTDPPEDVKWVTAAMQRQFEKWIRETPKQWMWSNR